MDRSLPAPARWASSPPAKPLAARWRAALAAAWDRLTMDADERSLRAARDLADLERRLRALERSGASDAPLVGPWR